MFISIDYSDGQYSVRECTDAHPNRAEIPAEVYEAYLSFCQQARVWHEVWCLIDNDTYDERRDRWSEWDKAGRPTIE